MSEKKSSMLEIYEWMGVVGKYTGCFPLPGLYEKRGWAKWTKGLINYVIPAITYSYLLYSFITSFSDYNPFEKQKNLVDMLYNSIFVFYDLHCCLCIVFNYLRLRRKLAGYLKMHWNLEELLKPKKHQLKRFVCVFFCLSIGLNTIKYQLFFMYLVGFKRYFQDYCDYTTVPIELISNFMFSLVYLTHPCLMYICFQRVLKSSFDQLLEKIQKNKNEILSCEMKVKKMRKYMKLYCDLGRLCFRLDFMVSPLMLTQFLHIYLSEIIQFTFFLESWKVNVNTIEDVLFGFFVLFYVSNVAYLTKKSRDKILPAFYSTFNSDEKAVKTELQNFSLQSMYFNKFFSASGCFTLDRELILAIIQSLISQVVVFYKITLELRAKTLKAV